MIDALPVTVIAGYLGAGKTTTVNHLLRHADGLRLAVLVNDFGELAIDEDLIEAEDDDIISIAGGCVCCSFGDDLTGALMDIASMKPRPDHVLIESSGVAIPSAIVGAISLLEGFRTDGIVILADAETIRQNACNKYMGDTVLRQIYDANIIVLNKTDLVDPTKLEATKIWLQEQNPDVRIMQASQGIVPPEVMLDSYLQKTTSKHHHHPAQDIETMTYIPQKRIDVESLVKKLADENFGIIRAKGFATSLTGQKKLVQIVGNRWEVSEAADHMEDGIVCLGFKSELSRENLSQLFLGRCDINFS